MVNKYKVLCMKPTRSCGAKGFVAIDL